MRGQVSPGHSGAARAARTVSRPPEYAYILPSEDLSLSGSENIKKGS